MNLEKYLVISGLPGVHKLVSTRGNGLVIEDRQEGRTRFVPVRQNQITPLATVGVYVDTEEGTVSLADVFQKMLDLKENTPPPGPDANSSELRAYFTSVLPEHDQDRVHINDIKKCVKWFSFMLSKGIFDEVKTEEDAAAAESTAEPTDKTEEDAAAAESTAEPTDKTEE
jgi:hypothetical protein